MIKLLKNKFTISVIAFLLLLIALVVLIIIPAIKEIKIINAQVYEERLRLEKLYAKGQLKNKVQKNYNSIKDDIVILDNTIMKQGQELEYITAIENIANKAGVDINISIGETKRTPQQRFSELEFTLTLTGKWENILSWIDKVEAMSVYTNIKEATIAVRKNEDSKEARQATATIRVNTFWLTPTL